MTVDEQLIAEARVRPRQALVAAGAAGLFLAAAALELSGPQPKVSELTLQLIFINKRFPLDLIGSVVQAAGLVALLWTLSFLFGLARARRPEMISVTRIVALAGGAVSAVAGIVYAAILSTKAHDFVQLDSQTYQQAKHLTGGVALPLLRNLNIAGEVLLQIAIVMIALNAMRVGLLTRFLGYAGIVTAVAGVFLIGTPPAVALEIFWLLALAYLFWGRWPNGDPPSWRTGQAEPWPSSQQLRQSRAGSGDDRNGATRAPSPTPSPVPETVGAPSARTRANTPKRKRKRRR